LFGGHRAGSWLNKDASTINQYGYGRVFSDDKEEMKLAAGDILSFPYDFSDTGVGPLKKELMFLGE
jgi:hypothetical protein